MKVVVITGSPHKKGTTSILAEQFITGALEAGHDVFRFDAAFKAVHPCIACEKCHRTTTGCTFRDDMEELNPHLLSADAVILISPIYYFALNTQIKAVIDRFYANDAALHGHKKTVLLAAMADDTMRSAAGAITSFQGMADYLQWKIAGMVIAASCADADALRKTDHPRQAYELGKNLS